MQYAIELSPLVQLVRIFGFHPEDPGSIPGRGAIFCTFFIYRFCSFTGQITEVKSNESNEQMEMRGDCEALRVVNLIEH